MEISVSQGASQGASQGKSFLARAFDLARPGVAPPPLLCTPILNYCPHKILAAPSRCSVATCLAKTKGPVKGVKPRASERGG